ncbi:MAG: hypothetical protein ACK5OC_21705, partial [Pirellula sp.]
VISNHIHLVLRSRPDVVDTWDDREVARRWLMICPKKSTNKGQACFVDQRLFLGYDLARCDD